MSNKETQDLLDKASKISGHLNGLSVMLHRMNDMPEIHFEIGFKDAKGHTKCVYSSNSINATMNEYARQEYAERDGYRIDVWQDGEPAADIDLLTQEEKETGAKVLFEINKKHFVGVVPTDHSIETPIFSPEYETVYRSASAIDCRGEWSRKRYTEPEYVMDIREAPEGRESYHVADIKIKSMVKEVPRMYGKDWLESLIKSHVEGDKGKVLGMPEQLAERIMQVYGRGQA